MTAVRRRPYRRTTPRRPGPRAVLVAHIEACHDGRPPRSLHDRVATTLASLVLWHRHEHRVTDCGHDVREVR